MEKRIFHTESNRDEWNVLSFCFSIWFKILVQNVQAAKNLGSLPFWGAALVTTVDYR